MFPQAMELREGETYMSVNHLEHCDGGLVSQLSNIIGYLRVKLHPDAMAGGAGVAILNAGKVRSLGAGHGHELKVLRTPKPPVDPAYARITGLPSKGKYPLLISALAREAFNRLHMISDVDALANTRKSTGGP